MKTAAYGLTCLLVGMLVVRYLPTWNTAYVIFVVFSVSGCIFMAGHVIEALTVNRSLWGEDRYERE